jgi:hypothetical protein
VWNLACPLREGHKLRMLENKVLREYLERREKKEMDDVKKMSNEDY